MAPRPNNASRTNKKASRVNSEKTSSTNSENKEPVLTIEGLRQILDEVKPEQLNQEIAVANEKKTSKRAPGRIAKAEHWDPRNPWHVDLLQQLQRHFGQGPMKKFVDTMRKRNIFYDYEVDMLSEILDKYKKRPENLPLAIAVVFMKQRKDNMDGFEENVIKLDFTDKQIRDKLDHMVKERENGSR